VVWCGNPYAARGATGGEPAASALSGNNAITANMPQAEKYFILIVILRWLNG
jgi:hypothetical protein